MAKNRIINARHTYNIDSWSEGYFAIDEQGFVAATPPKNQPDLNGFRLSDLVTELKNAGLRLPILVRFTDILQDRVESLYQAFASASESVGYQGDYTAVYPIKVNQQHSVVEELLKASPKVGLEAGSKPELLAILGAGTDPLTIICNGYKDSEFLHTAIIGQQMGHNVTVVVEKLSELKTLLGEFKKHNATCGIGIRIRLNSVGQGKWSNTAGEKGKFGLNTSQLLQAIDMLTQSQHLQLLDLIHFHIGSQIANIRDIQIALGECARYYCELRQMGVPIKTVDVGGGLGVDYEGSGSRSACSMNYGVGEYARNIVGVMAENCIAAGLPHPNIITESGRALTAHHAVLITNVIDIERPTTPNVECDEQAPSISKELAALANKINPRSALECYHDAIHCFSDGQNMFKLGLMSIKAFAELERLYFSVLQLIQPVLSLQSRSHREVLDELNEKLACKLFCNFSLFQSLPDSWGINQIFPVMPLRKLAQPLSMRAILQDITCDSDGQIKAYTDGMGIESSLPLPDYNDGEEYHVAMFLVGAYQEILGDLHNLFGDTDSAHVSFSRNGKPEVTNIISGDNAAKVLNYVNYEAKMLQANYYELLKKSDLDEDTQQECMQVLLDGIHGYTYFED